MGRGIGRYLRSNVLGIVAIFIALGGSAFAVGLAKNSVKSKQIKAGAVKNAELADGAVTSTKVENASLRSEDFASGQLPQGARGPQGEPGLQGEQGIQGVQGPAGTATAYARVASDAARTLEPDDVGFAPQVKGIEQSDVVPGEGGAATGTTCFDLPTRPASAMVALDNADAGANVDLIASVAIDRGEDLGDCPGTHNDARVRILDTDLTAGGAEQDPGPANARFFIWFE